MQLPGDRSTTQHANIGTLLWNHSGEESWVPILFIRYLTLNWSTHCSAVNSRGCSRMWGLEIVIWGATGCNLHPVKLQGFVQCFSRNTMETVSLVIPVLKTRKLGPEDPLKGQCSPGCFWKLSWMLQTTRRGALYPYPGNSCSRHWVFLACGFHARCTSEG